MISFQGKSCYVSMRLLVLTASLHTFNGVSAQEVLPLPTMDACQSTEHPVLPEKWKATALLQDFVQNHLVFGDFTFDDSVGAFRFKMSDRYGTNKDYLATQDGRLYSLGGGDNPTSCTLETKKTPFTVPSRNWLDDKAICTGEAPILDRNQAWWKTPRDQGADWIWYNTDNNLPFRTMYYEDSPWNDPVPVYQHFTFNYYPQFDAVVSTDLPEILSLCEQSTTPAHSLSWDKIDAHDLFADNTYPVPVDEPLEIAQSWIPGLSECESPDDLPPAWPEQVQGTVFMTAVSFAPDPFPSRVFYDWHAKAQNTSLYYAPPSDDDYVQVALLTGDTGYIRIEDKQGNISMCEQALPGPQVPDWKRIDGCECRAKIAPESILNPSSVPTSLLWCATDLSANQVFWTWYSEEGAPVVFMQTNSSPTAGTGLNLADYVDWKPGSVAPAGTFDLPTACVGKPKIAVPKACHNCHLPNNN